jgi:hypothetical protein
VNYVILNNNYITLFVKHSLPFGLINLKIIAAMKKTGMVLILIGLLLTIFTTFTFFSRERVAKIGDVNISANKRHVLRWSPLVGIAVIAIGGIAVWKAPKR